jgi:hypothetical protein
VDDRRFDSITRALATGASRRAGLRALAGAALIALARGRGVAAQAGLLGPGQPCRDNNQCFGDAPLVCADNGFAYDGPLNCCAQVGLGCTFDEHCCGPASCLDGLCSNALLPPGPGEPCTDSSQCLSADAPVTCGYVWSTGDTRCCTEVGSRCGADAACCGAARCANGLCASIALSAGDICQDTSQCQSGMTCASSAVGNENRCCHQDGGPCTWDGDCCGSRRCDANGSCTSHLTSGCNQEWCECNIYLPDFCASGLVCCPTQSGIVCTSEAACAAAAAA